MGSKTQKCIWMEAGAVEYQLCPLNLNCEKCDFYAQMTQGCHQASSTADDQKYITFQKPKIEDVSFQPGYQYLPGHFWFKHTSKNRMLMGMDDLLWKMMCPPKGIILTDPGTHIQRGSCFAWVVIPNAIVYLKMPLEGLVLNHNPQLDENGLSLNELRNMPVEEKWFLALEVNETDLQSVDSLTKQEYTNHVRQDCEKIYQTVNMGYSKHSSSPSDQVEFREPEADRLILKKQTFITLLNILTVNLVTIH